MMDTITFPTALRLRYSGTLLGPPWSSVRSVIPNATSGSTTSRQQAVPPLSFSAPFPTAKPREKAHMSSWSYRRRLGTASAKDRGMAE